MWIGYIWLMSSLDVWMQKQCTIYKLDTQKGLEQISVHYIFAQMTESCLSPLLAYYLTIKVLAYYLTIKVWILTEVNFGQHGIDMD